MAKTLKGSDITVSINGAAPVPCELRVEVERVDVSSFGRTEPDMGWEFVDAAGHFHAFDHEGNLPTLVAREHVEEQVEDTTEVEPADDELDDYEEDYDTGPEVWMHCLICDEVIVPKWRCISTPYQQFAPGRTSYTLTLRSEVPAGRFSVLVRAGERTLFGFGQGSMTYADQAHAEYVVWCGPISWRERNAA